MSDSIELTIQEQIVNTEVIEETIAINLTEAGPKGDAGETGPPGPAGPAGDGLVSYKKAFTDAEGVTITHNLGYEPSTVLVDSAGTEYLHEVEHINVNQCVVRWIGPMTGYVICN